MNTLTNAIIVTRLLKSSVDTQNAFRFMLRSAVHDPVLREYFEQKLDEGLMVPSRTILYRHRLMLTMGFANMLQEETKR